MSPKLERLLDVVDGSLNALDSGELFEAHGFDRARRVRSDLAEALADLLVWERPGLEASRGVEWPYRALRRRYGMLSELAENGADPYVRQQARLFLAFLPFPRQWSRLLELERRFGNEAEVRGFLSAERNELCRKLQSKPQHHFKLRHFCQILKAPCSKREKGVLRIFSLPYLLVDGGILRQLSRRYLLYVEPPMGVVFRHAWWRYFSVMEDPCIFGAHSEEDRSFLAGQKGAAPVGMAHGDFMEDIEWGGRGGVEKEYDIVFNATFDDMPRKRHETMLTLLLNPLLKDRTALFLGRGAPENVRIFQKRVEEMGLASRVAVLANVKRSEIPSLLSRCRIGAHLSLYENACRSVFEFFRSDLPCVVSSSMGGMSFELFNEKTGAAVRDDELPEAIHSVLRRCEEYAPREWFLNHSGSERSTEKLNDALRRLSAEWGYEWSRDVVRLGSSGASRYADKNAYKEFLPEFELLLPLFNRSASPSTSFSVE